MKTHIMESRYEMLRKLQKWTFYEYIFSPIWTAKIACFDPFCLVVNHHVLPLDKLILTENNLIYVLLFKIHGWILQNSNIFFDLKCIILCQHLDVRQFFSFGVLWNRKIRCERLFPKKYRLKPIQLIKKSHQIK